MKILAIALSGIGDAFMFTPSLIKLKSDFPDCQIDALVMFKGVENIYEKLPQINNIIFFDFLKSPKLKSLSFVLGLRNKYNAVINVYPANRKEYNLISFLIGSPKRLGINYLRKDFLNLGFLNNVTIRENDNLHNVEENFLLCEKFSGKKSPSIHDLHLILDKDDLVYAENYLKANSISEGDIVIGFHPGCSTLKNHEKRRWEPEKFSELAGRLIENFNAKILVFGGNDENELKDNIVKKINSDRALSVQTSTLLESAAVMKRCNVFVTNDSSLMHIASALKLNVVAIIGPTNTNYIRPWNTKHKIVSLNLDCSPCFFYSPKPLTCSLNDIKFKCIKELSAETVYKNVKDFLESVA